MKINATHTLTEATSVSAGHGKGVRMVKTLTGERNATRKHKLKVYEETVSSGPPVTFSAALG